MARITKAHNRLLFWAISLLASSCSVDGIGLQERMAINPSLNASSLYTLLETGGPSGSFYSGNSFPVSATVNLLANGQAFSQESGTASLALYSDATCQTLASGVSGLTASQNFSHSSSLNVSTTPTWTSTHSETDLYLGATYPTLSVSACSSTAANGLQKFASGSGYVDFQHGGTGAAGAAVGSKWDVPYAMALDSSNRIVISGMSLNVAGRYELSLWRYQPDGTLDTSFASGAGFVTYNPGGLGAAGATNSTKLDYPGNVLLIDSSGKIIISGQSKNTSSGYDAVIWRFNSDGSLDTSFGINGVVSFNPGGVGAAGGSGSGKNDDMGSGLIDSNGKYVFAGTSFNSAGGTEGTIWRYNHDGSLDTSFNSQGYVNLQHNIASLSGASNATKADYLTSVVQTADGEYSLGGQVCNSTDCLTTLWKLNQVGIPETSFGVNGATVFNGTSGTGPNGRANGSRDDGVVALVALPSGALVANVYANAPGGVYNANIIKFTSTGILDLSFNSGTGIKVLNNGSQSLAGGTVGASAESLAIDASGNFVATIVAKNVSGGVEPVLVRLLASGAYDTSFNSVGFKPYAQAGMSGPGGASTSTKADASVVPNVDSNPLYQPQLPLVIDRVGRYLLAFSADTGTHTHFEISVTRYKNSSGFDQ